MLTDDRAPTCSLVEFLEAWNEDPNLVWRVRTGHLIHLLEAAVGRIEALETWRAGRGRGGDETALVRGRSRRLADGRTRGGWSPREPRESVGLDPRATEGNADVSAMAPKHACLAQKVRTSTSPKTSPRLSDCRVLRVQPPAALRAGTPCRLRASRAEK
jgi:hypothetical protein